MSAQACTRGDCKRQSCDAVDYVHMTSRRAEVATRTDEKYMYYKQAGLKVLITEKKKNRLWNLRLQWPCAVHAHRPYKPGVLLKRSSFF